MNLIPVIDLMQGQVVRAQCGQRALYRPIVSTLCASAEPAAVARALATHCAAQQLYVADLDALQGRGVRHLINGEPTDMPSLSLWDAQVAYTGIKGLTLAVGARNLFDKQPATFVSVSNAFQSGYDISQYDPRGRFVYVNASFKF